MHRILIVGSGGSGKSTLARRMGEVTKLPVIHLDQHYWKPGWVASSPDEWSAVVDKLIQRPAWIMDGNYGGTMDQRLLRCDGVVFLDTPRLTCVRRLVRRRISYRGVVRPEMTEGCAERLSLEFLLYVWRYPRARRPGVLKRLSRLPATTPVFRLRNVSEVEAFLGQLRPHVAE